MTRTSAVLLFAGAILFYGIAKWQGASQNDDARGIREARQALRSGKAYRARQDSTQRLVHRAIVTVRVRDTVIVRLDMEMAQDTSARDSVVTLLMKVETLTAQRDILLSAVRLLTIRGDTAEARVDILNAHLAGVLTLAECHVLGAKWLPKCPSRTASFLLGGGMVALAIAAK